MQIVRFRFSLSHDDSGLCPEDISLRWGPWTRLGATASLQHYVQCKNIRFKNEDAVLPGMMLSRRLIAAIVPVVQHGLALGAQLESEFCLSCICPTPHGFLSDATDDACRLIHIQVTDLFVAVRLGFLHPETTRNPGEVCKSFVSEPDRGFQVDPRDQADGFYQ